MLVEIIKLFQKYFEYGEIIYLRHSVAYNESAKHVVNTLRIPKVGSPKF